MKCNKCGKSIKYVNCHYFNYVGTDSYEKIKIQGTKKDGSCYFIKDVEKTLTMFEFENSYEDFKDQISCPECDKFPFEDKSINIVQTATIIFGVSEEKEIIDGY